MKSGIAHTYTVHYPCQYYFMISSEIQLCWLVTQSCCRFVDIFVVVSAAAVLGSGGSRC